MGEARGSRRRRCRYHNRFLFNKTIFLFYSRHTVESSTTCSTPPRHIQPSRSSRTSWLGTSRGSAPACRWNPRISSRWRTSCGRQRSTRTWSAPSRILARSRSRRSLTTWVRTGYWLTTPRRFTINWMNTKHPFIRGIKNYLEIDNKGGII